MNAACGHYLIIFQKFQNSLSAQQQEGFVTKSNYRILIISLRVGKDINIESCFSFTNLRIFLFYLSKN